MVSSLQTFFLIFVLFNVVWFMAIWGNIFFSYVILPKFISSSYDKNATIDFDSMMFKSLNQIISKYFSEPTLISKHVGDLPTGNLSIVKARSIAFKNKYNEDIHNNKTSFTSSSHNKYFLLVNKNKTIVNIISVVSISSFEVYNFQHTEISLYTIPIDNFIIHNKSEFSLDKSLITKKWSTVIPGKYLSSTISKDMTQMLVTYKVIKGNVITYRLRYFNNINWKEGKKGKISFGENDNILMNQYRKYLDKAEPNSMFRFELIGNYSFPYDDFSLEGNTPITSMDVKNDTIIYSRNIDYYKYLYLKKNVELRKWEIKYKGEPYDRNNKEYLHVNSIKFLICSNPSNKEIIIRNELAINTTNIYSIVSALEISNNTISSKKIFKHIINDLSFYFFPKENMDHVIKQFKKYYKHTIFSNNLCDKSQPMNGIIEEMNRVIYSLSYNSKEKEIKSFLLSNVNLQVKSISADTNLENIVIQYEDGTFAFLNFNESKSLRVENEINFPELQGHLHIRNIVLNSLPKRIRNKKPLAFYIDKFDNNKRLIMLILMEDGVLFSLDFTDIIEKDKKGMWKWIFNECNYTILLIVFANILTFGIYFKMCRRMLGENNPRRAQEINQVINEMVRLNNDSNIDENNNNNSSNSNNENNNNSNNNNDNLVDESNSNEQQIPENIHQNENRNNLNEQANLNHQLSNLQEEITNSHSSNPQNINTQSNIRGGRNISLLEQILDSIPEM